MFQFFETIVFYKKELANMIKPRYSPKDGVYADLRDTTYFKESSLFSIEKDALQFELFYDNF